MMDLGQHFNRPILMDISKDGTITFRSRKAASYLGAIPVFSVDTEEEARRLLTYLCTEQDRDHPGLPGMRWYIFDDFTGNPADLDDVVEDFAVAYERLKPKAVAA
jgi:hypothetical protein